MTKQIRAYFLALAATLALWACAATGPAGSNGSSASVSVPPAASSAPSHGIPGYKRVVRNGETLYCTQEREVSTRLTHEVCLTQDQMNAREENGRNFAQGVQGMAVTPPSSPNLR